MTSHVGEEPSVQVRRGCLAGLTAEERRHAVDAFVSQITDHSKDDAVRVLSERAIAHAPEDRFAIMLMERSLEELRVMAHDYNVRTADRMAHRDLVTIISNAAAADKRDCELAFEWADNLQYRSLLEVLDAGGRIEFGLDEAAHYVDLKPFAPYTYLYINDDVFTFLITDVFKDNLAEARGKGIAQARNRADNVAACASALVELYGVVEAHEAHETYNRWYPGDALGFGAFAQCVIREASSRRYDFSCTNDGKRDYLVHYTLDAAPTATGQEARQGADKTIEARDRIIEAHKHVPMREHDREVAQLGAFEWKRQLEPVVELRDYLDAHVPQEENEYVFADRAIEELLFALAAVARYDIAKSYFEDKGLGALLEHDRVFDGLVTNVVEALPTWECNGWAPAEWHAHNARSAAKVAGPDGKMRKVGRNDPCPCGSGLKYKRCCGK